MIVALALPYLQDTSETRAFERRVRRASPNVRVFRRVTDGDYCILAEDPFGRLLAVGTVPRQYGLSYEAEEYLNRMRRDAQRSTRERQAAMAAAEEADERERASAARSKASVGLDALAEAMEPERQRLASLNLSTVKERGRHTAAEAAHNIFVKKLDSSGRWDDGSIPIEAQPGVMHRESGSTA